MASYTERCPHCGAVHRFEPEDAAIIRDELTRLEVPPAGTPGAGAGEVQELYGYWLCRCPGCGIDLMVHFSVFVHTYLALAREVFADAFPVDLEVNDRELFARLPGDLRQYAVPDSIVLQELVMESVAILETEPDP